MLFGEITLPLLTTIRVFPCWMLGLFYPETLK